MTFTLAVSVKRVVSDQIEQEMCKTQLTKNILAHRMGTSRAAVNRLLDPENTSITLNTLEKVALALNKRLKVELA
ncbi:MAG: XRE family transcriptional regulator [Desulfuromonadales bacterium]|nr:XRE family transcriptional regulator [Desulfuromonadales bacterium]